MLWRYVIGGAAILLFLLAFYPALENETLILVLYSAGLASLFYGLLNSPRAPEQPWSPASRTAKGIPAASDRIYPSAHPWFPVILIGGAAIMLLVIGIAMVGIFLLAIENNQSSSYSTESPGPDVFFINSDNGETRWLLREGDRINISESRYILISPEGFREQRGQTGITITPVTPLHVITMGIRNDTFWIETIQNEGEDLRFGYRVDLPGQSLCSPGDNGNTGECSTGPDGAAGTELRETDDGGFVVIVNDTGIARFGPPAVSDARGESRHLAYTIDNNARTISVSGNTGDLEYPLYWTLEI
jgi:hypothetical protein